MTMRKLPRDLVLILRTEAKNQRTPPVEYVIAEDGGRMVHRPEPNIAMAELLEEAAAALAARDAELAVLRAELNDCASEIYELRAQLAEARKALEASASALDEAREDVEHWGSYAGEYFQNKHDLEGDLDRIAKQASAARRTQGGQR